jgi:hypothetical protein
VTEQLADATRKRGEECSQCGQPTTTYRLMLSPVPLNDDVIPQGSVVCEACWREVVHLLESDSDG